MESIHPFWYLGAALILASVPLLIGISTSFVKVSIVLNMLRSALGAQQVPGNFVVFALSFALSAFIMTPVIKETTRLIPDLDNRILVDLSAIEATDLIAGLMKPLRGFLRQHSGANEMAMIRELSIEALPGEEGHSKAVQSSGEKLTDSDGDSYALPEVMLAFMLSELREAFAMGFVVLLPFLIIDLIVANILAGMGMFMVSPVMISLPLKILLFVVSDGWVVICRGLVLSYR